MILTLSFKIENHQSLLRKSDQKAVKALNNRKNYVLQKLFEIMFFIFIKCQTLRD